MASAILRPTGLAGFLERALQDPDWIAEQRRLAYPPLSPKPALRVVTDDGGPSAA